MGPAAGIVAAGLMLMRVAVDPLWIGMDQSLNLHYGQALLASGVPYVTFVDTNPPMIFYLSALPAALAWALGANPIPVFSVLAVLAFLASALALDRGLASCCDPNDARTQSVVVAAYVLFSLAVFHFGHLGQREHLWVLVWVPYFFLRSARWDGAEISLRRAVVSGLALGVAACLKPHFLAITLAPEAWWFLRRRDSRPLLAAEVLAAGAVVSLFALHFLVVPAAMREELFGRWAPLMLASYGAYDAPPLVLLRDVAVVAAGAALALAACLLGPSPEARKFSVPLAISVGAALAVYVLQGKGWSYHMVPALAPAALLCGLGLLSATRAAARGLGGSADLILRDAAPALLLIAVGGYVGAAVARNVVRISDDSARATSSPFYRLIERETRPGDRVLVVSTSVAPAYPALVQSGRLPASRYFWTFPVALVNHREKGKRRGSGDAAPHRMADQEARVLRELSEDLRASAPALVLIDHSGSCQGCPKRFDLFDYLTASGFVDRELRGYEMAGQVEGFVVYKPRPPA